MIKHGAISRSLLPSPSMINTLLACFVLIVASVTSVRVAAQAPAERYRNELQPLIEDFVHQQQIPGLAIGVIEGGRLIEYRGQATVSHGGGDPGYATFLMLLPEKKMAVVLMANCDWLGDGRAQIAQAALDVALGLKPQPITAKPTPR